MDNGKVNLLKPIICYLFIVLTDMGNVLWLVLSVREVNERKKWERRLNGGVLPKDETMCMFLPPGEAPSA